MVGGGGGDDQKAGKQKIDYHKLHTTDLDDLIDEDL